MNGLSLCSGIGGLDLGLARAIPGYRTVAYCEADPFRQTILCARMDDGGLDRAPIWPDVRTFDGRPWRGLVDLVQGGYPCQPFSVAGKRRGATDSRYLWPHFARIIGECQATWVFLENVSGHLRLGFRAVARDLLGLGYHVAAALVTATEVGAPHRRERLFVLADRNIQHDNRGRDNGPNRRAESPDSEPALDHAPEPRFACRLGKPSRTARARSREPHGRRDALEHAERDLNGRDESECLGGGVDSPPPWPPGPAERDRWDALLARWPDLDPAIAQPSIRRAFDGSASRVERLRALGNAVVPAQAAAAWRLLRDEMAMAEGLGP